MTFLPEPLETAWRPRFVLNARLTLAPMRHGYGDPTIRFDAGAIWRATRTPLGPATVRIEQRAGTINVQAWGSGREWAAGAVPRLLGAEDAPEAFEPPSGLLREIARRYPGLRMGRSDAVVEALVPSVCEQKVTGEEARRAYRMLIWTLGDPAPGPGALRLPVDPIRLSATPYYELHPLGLEQRRAATLRGVAMRARWLEAATGLPSPSALARLQVVRGVGPWTAAEAARVAFGDPDAVSVGDFHLPNLVSWALAGEPRADDSRMLTLLEPFRGQRARAARLLELSGLRPPRYGPRYSPRRIAAM